MSKIDKELLDGYDKQIIALFKAVQDLQLVHGRMTPQEKALAGAILLKIESPWGEKVISVFVGDKEKVAILINKAGYELQSTIDKPSPPVFTDKDKLPN